MGEVAYVKGGVWEGGGAPDCSAAIELEHRPLCATELTSLLLKPMACSPAPAPTPPPPSISLSTLRRQQ